DRPDLRDIGAADAILHRPTHWRTELEGRHTAYEAWKFVRQHFFELLPQPFARWNVFRDDDGLTEEVIGKLDIERQIEPDCAAADIGAPARDIGITFENLVDAARDGFAGKDRSVLRQRHVDEQFGPIPAP